MQYTWDPSKSARNLKERGISFEEAARALETDDNALVDVDLDQASEIRCRITAWSRRGRLLFVIAVEWDGNTLRIVSARKAERPEEKRYARQG